MISRLGFNNKGVDHLVRQVKQRRYRGILGINIGRNFDTPNDKAVEDYLVCFEKVYEHADYITINISSPNTEGLRDLQAEPALDALLSALGERRAQLAGEFDRCVPIVVKVAPDLDEAGIQSVARVTGRHRIDAVVATNTTVERPGVAGLEHAAEQGGLSGAPLRAMADHVLSRLRAALPPQIALIGVGGITTGGHAAQKIALGADLVQFYTGFVYRGPDLIPECLDAIAAKRAAA